MRIAIGSDERTDTTEAVVKALEERGHQVELYGPLQDGDDRQWAEVSEEVARRVAAGDADRKVPYQQSVILADALTRASEEGAATIVDFATLTGAARVALGPDLPPLFTDDEALASELLAAGTEHGDPLWRMPLWDGYDDMLTSDVADLV